MKHVPFGIRDFLPHEVKQRESVIRKIQQLVESDGYERIITPSIEHYDNIYHALGTDLKDTCIMFFDGSGSRLVLRPDHTAVISRIASSRLLDQLPVKLYYYDPVFRKDPILGETEIYQFGLEHIGVLNVADEMAIIKQAIRICQDIGIEDVEIHMAHPELFRSVSTEQYELMRRGDLTSFSDLPKKLSLKDVSQSPYFDTAVKALDNIGISDNVFVNEGLFKDLSYYNGVYFDIVSPSYGKVLGSGGRYDVVLNSFGVDSNAFGFALNMHYLEKAIHG